MAIIGTTGNEVFIGTTGSDSIIGGGGFDVLAYDGLPAGYTLSAQITALGTATIQKRLAGITVGTDTISGISVVLGTAGSDLFDLSGPFGTSSIAGPVMVIAPGAGDDTINAGNHASVELDYSRATAAVAVSLQTSVDAGGNRIGIGRDGQGGIDTLINVLRVRGSAFSDRLLGGDGDDVILGSTGSDTLTGAGGANTLDYTGLTTRSLTVTLTAAGAGSATKTGGTAAEIDNFTFFGTIIGSAGADRITGYEHTTRLQVLQGMAGADTIDGGESALNLVDYSRSAAGVVINLGTGLANDGWGSVDTLRHVLHVRGSAFSDIVAGDSSSSEIFEASLGSDSYAGNGGTDTLTYAGLAGARLTVTMTGDNAGTVVKSAGGGTDSFTGISVIEGTADADVITGFAGATRMTLLRGMGGVDTIDGAGNALNLLDYSLSYGVSINLGTGVGSDGVGSYDFLRNIRAVQTSIRADVVIGGAASETFYGSAGADSYAGNAGFDTLNYERYGSPKVVVSFDAAGTGTAVKGTNGTLGQDSFTGIEAVVGTNAADTLGGHVVSLAGGPLYLDGRGGNDVLRGYGVADNVADYLGRSGPLTATLGASGSASLAGGEVDTLTAIVAIRGTNQNDSITGSAADESFQGAGGNDTILGGGGHDTVILGGLRAATTLTRNADGSWTAAGPDGTDTLRDVEAVRFADATVALNAVERDFNGDGRSEILFDNTAGTYLGAPFRSLSKWYVDGAAFQSGDTFAGVDMAWSVAGTGDFNGDGKADLLWHQPSGMVSIWLLDNGVLTSGTTIYAPAPGTAFDVAGIADFNGDGRSDILFSRQEQDGLGHAVTSVSLWQMNGLAGAGGGGIATVDAAWSIVGTGDFDADGRADILWQHADSSVAIWRMDGTTFLGGDTVGTPGLGWTIAGVGDLNGDGRSDLVWQFTDGTVAGWLMDGTTFLAGDTIYRPGIDWTIAAVGDYNGDGKSDLLWRHAPVAGSGTTEMQVWTMNGLQVAQAATLTYVANEWQVV